MQGHKIGYEHFKDEGAEHAFSARATGAHVIGVKHLRVMTFCFLTRTKVVSRSHICSTHHITHMLNLQAYDVTKKWVIITEISKEVENNNIEDLMRILSIMCLEVLV